MLGSVPGWGTKVPEATWQKRKKKVAQKHIHKWKRIDSPEIKPCLCGQVIYNQGAKYI